MKIDILDEAEEDLIKGFQFYERQSAGLGRYFLDSIFSDIESLKSYAGIHPLHFGYHRFLAKHFPFAVYYRVVASNVHIYAVLDCRRNPAWIRNRLS
ncbi:MAG TPA: type II toxin-antitoxin system RelE/ParE family toxin [Desulfobacteraceae bacterium]|nr:hypothetical protein [Syntrophaceae bacterium]HDR14375.1 type II toxin-antitoxin system RelE/ParE family toxin [Desulfobacteraceae bacterium]